MERRHAPARSPSHRFYRNIAPHRPRPVSLGAPPAATLPNLAGSTIPPLMPPVPLLLLDVSTRPGAAYRRRSVGRQALRGLTARAGLVNPRAWQRASARGRIASPRPVPLEARFCISSALSRPRHRAHPHRAARAPWPAVGGAAPPKKPRPPRHRSSPRRRSCHLSLCHNINRRRVRMSCRVRKRKSYYDGGQLWSVHCGLYILTNTP